jgi:hypothetical protein
VAASSFTLAQLMAKEADTLPLQVTLAQTGMRFENISNDLKCILFEKYGFLFQKSPIHVYQ